MKSVAVLNRCLIILEQQELVSNVQQGERDQCDGDQDRNNPAEGHRDKEGGDEVGVSLANGVYFIRVEIYVFSLGLSGGVLEATSGVPTFFDAADHAGEEELDD